MVTLVVAVSLGGVQTSASARLQTTIDENFRGAYDLLVRPQTTDLGLARTQGLVEQDFLGLTGTGGISLATLAAVRGMAGVELAAPVAVVGYVKTLGVGPCVHLDRRPEQSTLFTYAMTATTSDGRRQVLLQRQETDVLLPAAGTTSQIAAGDALRSATTQKDGTVNMCFSPLPTVASPVIGVDPVAERALLGPTADFLKPFSDISHREGLTTGRAADAHIPSKEFPFAAIDALLTAQASAAGGSRPLVPVVIRKDLSAPLQLTLTVARRGKPLQRLPASVDSDPRGAVQEAAQTAGPGLTAMGTTTLDATTKLVPFTDSQLELSAPGSGPARVTDGFSHNNPDFDAQRASWWDDRAGKWCSSGGAGPRDGGSVFDLQSPGTLSISSARGRLQRTVRPH